MRGCDACRGSGHGARTEARSCSAWHREARRPVRTCAPSLNARACVPRKAARQAWMNAATTVGVGAAGIAVVWHHRLEIAHSMQAGLAAAADSGSSSGIALSSSAPGSGRCCAGTPLLYSGAMFAGHFAVACAAKGLAPRTSLGTLISRRSFWTCCGPGSSSPASSGYRLHWRAACIPWCSIITHGRTASSWRSFGESSSAASMSGCARTGARPSWWARWS